MDEFIIAAPAGSDGTDARSYLPAAADVRGAIQDLVDDEAHAKARAEAQAKTRAEARAAQAEARAEVRSDEHDEVRSSPSTTKFSFADFYASSFLSSMDDSIETVAFFNKAHMGTMMKKFYRADALEALDQGNHDGTTTGNAAVRVVDTLRLLHFHYRNITVVVRKALDDIHGFGWDRELRSCTCASEDWALCFTGPVLTGAALVQQLERLPSTMPSRHKVNNFLGYTKNGAAHFVRPAATAEFSLPPLPTMLKEWGLRARANATQE